MVQFKSLNLLSTDLVPKYLLIGQSPSNKPEGDNHTFDIQLYDSDGKTCMNIQALEIQLSRQKTNQPTFLFTFDESEIEPALVSLRQELDATEKASLLIKQYISKQLGISIDQLGQDKNYMELGISSMGLAALIKELNNLLEENILPSILFEHVTINMFSLYLAEEYKDKINRLLCFKSLEKHNSNGIVSRKELTPVPHLEHTLYSVDQLKNLNEEVPKQTEPEQLSQMLEKLKHNENNNNKVTKITL
jgi:hypothetical protein